MILQPMPTHSSPISEADLLSKFVLHDVEVKLTGRKASKKGVGTKVNELVEVTPSEEDNGTWKKWVPMNTLFQIEPPRKDEQ